MGPLFLRLDDPRETPAGNPRSWLPVNEAIQEHRRIGVAGDGYAIENGGTDCH